MSAGAAITFELIFVASALFLVFGIDDLVVDLIWVGGSLRRRFTRPQVLPRDVETAPRFAIIIPAWQEAAVIAPTISRCLEAYAGHAVRIIVGCYANDPRTIAAVESVSDARVSIALNRAAGLTTKGDCLNAIWRQLREIERTSATHFDAVVLHDAEDWVSEEELTVFARGLNSFALQQLPVVPIMVRGSPWISGHYLDEFAESHRRAMIVRQTVGAAMPSAGVGCCIRRDLLDALQAARCGDPFDPDCLTEDYELGLFAKSHGFRSAFLRCPSERTSGIVATRACFPHDLEAAVRQKARWITGIALSGWDRTGWGQGWTERWMRFRDRKTVLEAFALLCAYLGVALHLAGTLAAQAFGVILPAVHQDLDTLLLATAAIMVWRLAVRAYCTGKLYGWRQGGLAVPRALTGNLIAILATRRAVWLYFRMHRAGRAIWEKTEHDQPIDRAALGYG